MRSYNDLITAIVTLFVQFLSDLKPLIEELRGWEGQDRSIGMLVKHGSYAKSFVLTHFQEIAAAMAKIEEEAKIAEERAAYDALQTEYASMKAELEALKASKAGQKAKA